jgi:hypothetical protein
MKSALPIVSAAVFLLLSQCDSPVDIESKWADAEIAFDGNAVQWKDTMQYPTDPQFGIGARNDSTYLYICITSWNRTVNRQILHLGFTTWFTSHSKKGKRFGIHFPLGMRGNAWARHEENENRDDPEAMKAMFQEALQELELLGPGKDDSIPVKTKVAESFGIASRMFRSEENLVYEIKVPLRQDSVRKYAIDPGNDSLLMVTFESTVHEVESHNNGEDHGETPGGGGRGMGSGGQGGRGMGGGGGGGHGGEGRPAVDEMPDQFKASVTIKLARRPIQGRPQ